MARPGRRVGVLVRARRADVLRGGLRPPAAEARRGRRQAPLVAGRKPALVLAGLDLVELPALHHVRPVRPRRLLLGPRLHAPLERVAVGHLQVEAGLGGVLPVDVLAGRRAAPAPHGLLLALRRVPVADDDPPEAHDLLQVLVEDVVVGARVRGTRRAEAAGALHQVVRAHHGRDARIHRCLEWRIVHLKKRPLIYDLRHAHPVIFDGVCDEVLGGLQGRGARHRAVCRDHC
mmetsp:Transcript_7637/g.21386  ORF Transcript_7637/g.21386 Transcript_7637/m.21386 type:complete len:232 (-) Transcript_7637:407-1102(-)